MDQNNIIIIFTQKADSALLNIEKKYNLEENDEEWMKKLKEKKPFKTNIVTDLIRKFAKENISKEKFINSLEQELKINKDTAEKILEDIVGGVMPFLTKTSNEEIEKGAFRETGENNDNNKEIQPTLAKPIRLIKEENSIKNNRVDDKIQKIVKIKEKKIPETNSKIITEKEKIIKTEKPIKKDYTKKQADTYRESI